MNMLVLNWYVLSKSVTEIPNRNTTTNEFKKTTNYYSISGTEMILDYTIVQITTKENKEKNDRVKPMNSNMWCEDEGSGTPSNPCLARNTTSTSNFRMNGKCNYATSNIFMIIRYWYNTSIRPDIHSSNFLRSIGS